MSYWHELHKMNWRTVIKNKEKTLVALIQHPTLACDQFVVHFLKYEGIGPPRHYDKSEYGWTELWPYKPMIAETEREASRLAHTIIDQPLDNFASTDFEWRPYSLPQRPESVRKLEPEAKRVHATIFKHSEAKYEVRYFAHMFIGTWPSGSEEWDWIRTRHEIATFADSLESAEEIAQVEIEQLTESSETPTVFYPNTLFPT